MNNVICWDSFKVSVVCQWNVIGMSYWNTLEAPLECHWNVTHECHIGSQWNVIGLAWNVTHIFGMSLMYHWEFIGISY